MAVAIRDDVAEGKPYNQLIERLLAEPRRVAVYACPKDECPRSLFVFYEENTSLIALEHHVLLLLERTSPGTRSNLHLE